MYDPDPCAFLALHKYVGTRAHVTVCPVAVVARQGPAVQRAPEVQQGAQAQQRPKAQAAATPAAAAAEPAGELPSEEQVRAYVRACVHTYVHQPRCGCLLWAVMRQRVYGHMHCCSDLTMPSAPGM